MNPSKLPWTLRTHERLPCFIEAEGTTDDGEMAYSLEVLGDDYSGFGGAEQRQVDAQFIVTACNAHDQLVAALKELADMEYGHLDDEAIAREEKFGNGMAPVIRRAREALAAAGAA